MKTIWLTSLCDDKEDIKGLMTRMKPYGIEIQGHFWQNDLKKIAWINPLDELLNKNIAVWIISGSEKELLEPDLRYGLSMLAISLQAQRGLGFPIVILQTTGNLLSANDLPTPLKNADVLSATDSGPGAKLGAKLVAKVHTPPKKIDAAYHMNIHASEQIGQWIEIRPVNDIWPGVIFGVVGAKISFQAVGPQGKLPDKSILNYPMQGLKINLGDKEYIAWATQNKVDKSTSYFVKVDEFPESILFGPYSTESEAELFIMQLK